MGVQASLGLAWCGRQEAVVVIVEGDKDRSDRRVAVKISLSSPPSMITTAAFFVSLYDQNLPVFISLYDHNHSLLAPTPCQAQRRLDGYNCGGPKTYKGRVPLCTLCLLRFLLLPPPQTPFLSIEYDQ